MEKFAKFTYLVGKKKLTFNYYKNTQLKTIDGLKKKIHPIYIQISFDRKTQNIPSILWKQLAESKTNSVVFSYLNPKGILLEAFNDNLDLLFKSNDTILRRLCEYEFDCITRIIDMFCGKHPKTVNEVVNAYQFWAQDGLREACTTFLENLIKPNARSIQWKDQGKGASSAGFRMETYEDISSNAKFIISTLLEQNVDPVSIVSWLHESKAIENLSSHLDKKMIDDFVSLAFVIGSLISGAFLLLHSLEPKQNTPSMEFARRFGIYYFPKIHFFYPISDDQSSVAPMKFSIAEDIKSIDLLKLQSLLSKS